MGLSGLLGAARVGCSGWQYKHWRADFYPSKLPVSRWFEHYASVFDTVEINNTFYRLPEASTFAAWAERAPANFLYAVKASRLTHMKKLKDPEEPVERLFTRMRPLRRHLGPILYQLPPGWKLDRERLDQFLHTLPRRARHAIEFRDPSWYVDEVFELLAARGVALCLHDMVDRRRPGSESGRLYTSGSTARAEPTPEVIRISVFKAGLTGCISNARLGSTCTHTSITT